MGTIKLEGVEKWFEGLQVIKGIDLGIADGEFVIFVGPSGCGKSTLLRLISGLEETSVGRIVIDDRDVTALPPAERSLSMVFQSYALYPHLSVRDNIGFPLKMAGLGKSAIDAKVGEAARILKLEDFLARRPKALSGGQRQRVAIGRAIVRDPAAFLFDEPLSNLDAALRVEMRFEIAKLHQDLQATMIYVTHDQVEAMTLADKIVVLRAGQIEQVGSPIELYERPANLFVAQFIGSPKMNVMPCDSSGEGIFVAGNRMPDVPSLPGDAVGRSAKLGIRPEHIALADNGSAQLSGRVEVAEHLGSDTFLYVSLEGAETVVVRAIGNVRVGHGETVGLNFDADHLHLFDRNDMAIAPAMH